MKHSIAVLAVLACGIAQAQEAATVIEMCEAAGESPELCSCGQVQANALMTPEVQNVVIAGFLTGKPPKADLAALGLDRGQVFDLMAQWSMAVETNCNG